MSQSDAALIWAKVRWRSARMSRAKHCCYCGCELLTSTLHCIVQHPDGHSGEFCASCARQYFHIDPPPRRGF